MLTLLMVAALINVFIGDEYAARIGSSPPGARPTSNNRKTAPPPSTHDALTSLYNRAYFEEEQTRLESSQEFPVTVIVADIDDLKVINDTRGHAVGDQILKCAAELLSSAIRSSDVLARIGGDEFAVLLSRTDAAIAARLLQRLQENLTCYNLEHPELQVRLSFGTATALHGNLGETLKLADQRMYEHKLNQKLK